MAASAMLGSLPAPLLRSLRLKTKQQELLLRVSALALIYVLAFAVRLFSVLRYESMIHEFDPYFNYRTTLYLTEHGYAEFWNWFDSESWYPLGRVVGGTLFPGLMVTAALLHRLLHALSLAVHIREVFFFLDWVKYMLDDVKLFKSFLRITLTCVISVGTLALGIGTASGYISPWTGRFYSLLDPTYAKDHIPIIASVSEHQPTAWSSFMFDFHILLFLFPAGLYFCFKRLSDATIFIVMYGLTSMYFAGVMVRLILVAAPAVCLISAIAVSATIKNLTTLIRTKSKSPQTTGKATGSKAAAKGAVDQPLPFQHNAAIALLLGAFYLLSRYAIHCTWVTSEAYSSPSIVLSARGHNGGRVIFDDYREAYYWLRQNTPTDAKIMSWWDYGYQITAMGNRTVIVDNNTWNNTHIATVGRAMSSSEDEAYEIMQSLDVNYVLVVFGGVTGYSSDDINKFLWMVRIGGGVFPVIKEPDYLVNGEYRVDKGASPKMLNCLMYKLCYYRFGELTTEYGKPPGYDRVRGVEIGNKDVKLEYLEEAYTTLNWIVRIYKVKPPKNRS